MLGLHNLASHYSRGLNGWLQPPTLAAPSHTALLDPKFPRQPSLGQRQSRHYSDAPSALASPGRISGNADNVFRDSFQNGSQAQEPDTSLSAPLSRVKRAKTEKSREDLAKADLRTIPGVGSKNAELLMEAGYQSSRAILEVYQKECSLDAENFLACLKDKVGIKQKKWRDLIAGYCRAQYPKESEQYNRRYWTTLSVEGNISAGKSTFLNGIAQHCPDLQDLLCVSPEPVGKWQSVGGGNFNLLEEFYSNKERFAYTFQNYIFITRLLQEQESAARMNGQPYRLLERSVWCDRMVFVQSLKESGLLSELEMSLYHAWFDPLVQTNPTLVPDGFIYLRAGPGTCMDRLKVRKRSEEVGVDMNYLEDLHSRHEKWLYDSHMGSVDDMSLSTIQDRLDRLSNSELWRHNDLDSQATNLTMKEALPKIPALIKDDVKILNKGPGSTELPSKIVNLPALVLDCEKHINDVDAQKEHAEKVNAYFKYVKDMRRYKLFAKSLESSVSLDQAWRKQTISNGTILNPADLLTRSRFEENRKRIAIDPRLSVPQLAFA